MRRPVRPPRDYDFHSATWVLHVYWPNTVEPHKLGQDTTALPHFHWLVNNRLSMHKGKTEALIMSTKRKRHNTKTFQIHHDEHVIKPTLTAK